VTSPSPEFRPSKIRAFPGSTGRVSALSGALASALLIASFAVLGTDFPTYDDAPRVYAQWYADNTNAVEVSSLLGLVGLGALVWFFGYLRWTLGNAEREARGFERAAPLAFGAGVAGVSISLMFGVAHEAAVVAQGTVEPGVVRALDLAGAYALVAAAIPFTIVLFSAFFLIRVTRSMPQWLSVLGLIATPLGVVQAFVLVAPSDDNGLLGVIGFAWFTVFMVWTIGASITLARQAK
jgi:hypothetical protein